MIAYNLSCPSPLILPLDRVWLNPTPSAKSDNIVPFGQERLTRNTLKETYRKLEEMKTWQSNWDGYDSVAPKIRAINNTEKFIKLLNKFISNSFYDWLAPHISASESGEIVLEWWQNKKKMTVYLSASEINYIKIGGENIEDMEDGLLKLEKNSLVSLWEWLIF